MSNHNNRTDEQVLSDLYQSTRGVAPGDGPSEALDAAILAQSKEALTPRRKRPAWLAPVGLAATVLIGFNLAVGLKDRSEEAEFYENAVRASAEQDQAPDAMSSRAELAESDRVARMRTTEAQKKQQAESDKVTATADVSELVLPTPGDNDSDLIQAGASDSMSLENSSQPQTTESGDSARIFSTLGKHDAARSAAAAPAVAANVVDTQKQAAPEPRALTTDSEWIGDGAEDSAFSAGASEPRTAAQESIAREARAAPEMAPSPVPQARSGSSTESAEASDQTLPTTQPRQITAASTAASTTKPADVSADLKEAELEADRDAALLETPMPVTVQTDVAATVDNSPSELQEVVVTGSRAARRDDSPHRRLMAKDQAKDNQLRKEQAEEEQIREEQARQQQAKEEQISKEQVEKQQVEKEMARTADPLAIELTHSFNSQPASAAPPSLEAPPVFQCNYDDLGISKEDFESAKVEALTFEPPMNAVRWPELITFYANAGNMTDACAHLAAFRQLFPDLVLLQPLPVALPVDRSAEADAP